MPTVADEQMEQKQPSGHRPESYSKVCGAGEIDLPSAQAARLQFHFVLIIITCNHIVISHYGVKSEPKSACGFHKADFTGSIPYCKASAAPSWSGMMSATTARPPCAERSARRAVYAECMLTAVPSDRPSDRLSTMVPDDILSTTHDLATKIAAAHPCAHQCACV